MRVLAIADEVVASVWTPGVRAMRPDVVLAAGDLPFEYLEFLVDTLDVPLGFVPGNHDPDLSGYRLSRAGLTLRAGMPGRSPAPAGAVALDGRCLEVGGLLVAGLGGSPRYRPGPNQYTEREQRRRSRDLVRAARRQVRRSGRPVDVLLTHAPPAGVGDGADPAHRGFACLHDVVTALRPRLLLHGHVHPYGQPAPDRVLGATRVVNVVGHHLLEI